CTGGAAGDSSGCPTARPCCPFNTVDLTDVVTDADGELKFIVQTVSASNLYINNVQLKALAPNGIHVENLRFASGPCSSAPGPGGTFDLAPGATVELSTEALIGTLGTPICVVADAIGPIRP